jgi:hypothetical protein
MGLPEKSLRRMVALSVSDTNFQMRDDAKACKKPSKNFSKNGFWNHPDTSISKS